MTSIPVANRQGLNNMNASAFKFRLGNIASNNIHCVKGVWNFATDGGAVASYNLKNDDGETILIPSGALILNGFSFAKTAFTSGGSATIGVQIEAANDLLSAEAKTSFDTINKVKSFIPVFATSSTWIVTTVDRNLVLKVNTAAATAGKIYCYVQYVLTL